MADALASLSLLSGGNLLAGTDPQSANSTALSVYGSGRRSRSVGGTNRVVFFLDVYGLLWTVRVLVGCWAWIRPA